MITKTIAVFVLAFVATGGDLRAQPLMPAPALSPSASPEEETIIPTFETQKLARTYILDVPAPRGQITDRNGAPLAQNRLSYNLVVNFPTPPDFSDAQALSFTREKIGKASDLIGRKLRISDDAILRHYRNRGIMPLEIAQNLSQAEYEKIKDQLPAGVTVRPVYVRIYPNGKVAGQIIGYTGKTGRNPDGIVDNHETLWPETEGREGLEQTFNGMLTGRHGEYKLTFDKDGRKTSEKLITPPEPGYNVVTTLDLHLQPTCSCHPSRPSNSRHCKTIQTYRFCHERIVRHIRLDQPLKLRWALLHWKAMPFIPRTNTNACRQFRLATSPSTTGKKAIAAR